jgi:hypothetical protein
VTPFVSALMWYWNQKFTRLVIGPKEPGRYKRPPRTP